MIEAIKEIGENIKNKKRPNKVEIFVEKAKLDKGTKKVLCILFQHNDGEISYKKVIPENYDSKKSSLYLYRGGSPRGVDILPSALVTDKVKKTFRNKIVNWFKNRDGELFRVIEKVLKVKKDVIEKELIERYNEIPKDERRNVLITVKLEENENERYIGEIDTFKNVLTEDTVRSYYYLKSIGESKGDGTCYLCGNSREVFGFVLSSLGFSFSTADKRGFSSEFIQTNHWKEIPICEDCAMSLELGKRFIDENLSFPKKGFNFFGCKYYVIPKFVFGEFFDEFYDVVAYYKDKEYTEGLLSDEDYLENTVKEKGDILRLIFLFYAQKGGGKYIDIVRCVEDVIPSWIRGIYGCQEKVKKINIFQEGNMKKILGREWTGDFVTGRINKENGLGRNNWFTRFTRDFFPSSKTEGIYDKYFIETVSSILSGNQIDKDFIISTFVRKIRNVFKKGKTYDLKILCLKAFMLHLFLVRMNLLRGEKMEEKGTVEKVEERDLESKTEQFFKEHGFDNPAKKAAFLMGTFIDYLLWVQRSERNIGFGEEPFWNSLYGLLLDERKIKRLFPKAIGKLRQYRRGYPSLEKIVSKYLRKTEKDWNISNDEASYYFALGMTLGGIFSKKEEKEEVK